MSDNNNKISGDTENKNTDDTEHKTIRHIENYKVIEYNTNNIYIIEDIFDASFCQEMRTLIDNLPLKKTAYTNGNNVECSVLELSDVLKPNSHADELYYSFSTNKQKYDVLLQSIILATSSATNTANNIENKIYKTRLNGYTSSQMKTYNKRLNEKMQIVARIMKEVNNKIKLKFNCGYTLRKHYGATRHHCDGLAHLIKHSRINNIYDDNDSFEFKNINMARDTTCIFSLNDDFEGGEFLFPDKKCKFHLKPGSVVLFPPFWTHPHEVSTITSSRYTICTWSCEPIE